jgi:hypothetical protein
MPLKNAKRRRIAPADSPSAPPFTFEILAKAEAGKPLQGRVSTHVTLSVPSADEECPLTLEPISQSKLECLDAPFVTDRPLHTKLTLPCGHSFHALTLIYSWCKSDMRCPFCRAGHPNKADPACLPPHLKTEISQRVTTVLEQERQSDARAETNVRVLYNMVIPYTTLVDSNRLFVRMDLLDSVQQTTFSLNAPLERSGELLRSRGDYRNLGQMSGAQIRVSVTMVWSTWGTVAVDESVILRIRPDMRPRPARGEDTNGARETFAVPLGSTGVTFRAPEARAFSLLFTQPRDTENILLNSISWDPGAEALELLTGEQEMGQIMADF